MNCEKYENMLLWKRTPKKPRATTRNESNELMETRRKERLEMLKVYKKMRQMETPAQAPFAMLLMKRYLELRGSSNPRHTHQFGIFGFMTDRRVPPWMLLINLLHWRRFERLLLRECGCLVGFFGEIRAGLPLLLLVKLVRGVAGDRDAEERKE